MKQNYLFIFLLALLLPGFYRMDAAVFYVTNSSDAGAGSLRQAISDANTAQGRDTVYFSSATDGSPVILSTGAITVSDSVNIQGNGPGATVVDGNSSSVVFSLSGGYVLFLNLAVINGAPYNFDVAGGTLSLYLAESYGAQIAAINFGMAPPSACDLALNYCYLHGNAAGITGNVQNADVYNSSFMNSGDNFNFNTVSGNYAFVNSTFAASATGILAPDPGPGKNGSVINCTFSGNTVGFRMIEKYSNAASVSFTNNILYGNSMWDYEQDTTAGVGPTPILQDHNVVGTCLMQGQNCQPWYSSGDPQLGPFVFNGGYWPTFMIPGTGNCIDAGNSTAAPSADERGYNRDASPDIGAVEFGACGLQATISNYAGPSCAGMSNGFAEVTPLYGAAPYAYSWTSGDTTQMISNLGSGIYQVTVTDNLNCTAVATVTLNAPSLLGGSASSTSASCYGEEDGTATVTASGGTAPYYYNWQPGGQGGSIATGLFAGTYTCVLTDSAGCQANVTATVAQPSQIVPAIGITQPTCNNADGVLTATASGGTGPYSYDWSTGDMASSVSGIASGQYLLDVTDATGCLVSKMVNVTDVNAPVPGASALNNVSCADSANGSLTIAISGGAAPYTVYWSDLDTSDHSLSRTGLGPASYDIMVYDAAGCLGMATYTITEPNALDAFFSVTGSHCGIADGILAVTASGGTAPYNYLWGANAGNAVTPTVNGLGAGIYNLTVTDANGCMLNRNAYLSDTVFAGMDITASYVSTNCGAYSGLIDITVFGGTPPFIYQWSTGQTSEDMHNIQPGEYGLTVKDSNNCVYAADFWVENNTEFYDPVICMVSVDTADNRNVIYFEASPVSGIKEYKVHRETSTPGVYVMVGTQPAGNQAGFKDTVANAGLHGWKYRISAYDSCGTETGMSEIEHRPVYLTTDTANGNISLVWTDYMGTSSFSYYYIWRNHITTGWMLIDSVASTVNTYTDTNVPAQGGAIDYYVEIQPSFGCNATRAIINTSRSNVKSQMVPAATIGMGEYQWSNAVAFYPNPAGETLHISGFSSSGDSYTFKLVDVRGRELMSGQLQVPAGKFTQTISLQGVAQGAYVILLSDGRHVLRKKLIKS